ncbi:hypothetical protein F4V90_27105 [Neorhizobium galegae]|nr:hypothetical protein F4V90_27105 [Neorhizobium galegae]
MAIYNNSNQPIHGSRSSISSGTALCWSNRDPRTIGVCRAGFRVATGRQMRRSPDGGITIKSAVAVFG